MHKGVWCFLLIVCLIFSMPSVRAEDEKQMETEQEGALQLSAETAVIMEKTTGQILYEKAADEPKAPASVTKIMTLLLIFDAISQNQIGLQDMVTTSEYAASMGGSQVFLEPGEEQTVDTMIKCIAVASANDACVAMAEKISGNEEAFVASMNERAKGLGMDQTHFVNCNGLDAQGHVTTAKDIARMSRELITKYPQIRDYTLIWMENITHTTKKGTSEFGLTNTNKLIRQYEYATGLKTGSTGEAKFCLSATAEKDGIELIAVVMAEPDAKTRTKDVISMLNYGFSKCAKYEDAHVLEKPVWIEVERGEKDRVEGVVQDSFQYIDVEGNPMGEVKKEINLTPKKAPVHKGDIIGNVVYRMGDAMIGEVPIKAAETVEKMNYMTALKKTAGWMLGKE